MYILADIGGTKSRVAESIDLETFSEPVIFDTPAKYDEGLATLKETIAGITEGKTPEAVMLGLPGVVLKDQGSVHDANIPDWNNRPIVHDLESATQAQVHIENDTALVGLGEAIHGAGKGSRIVMYMTVSTGVNAVRLVDGKIDEGHFGAETGDQYLIVGGEQSQLGDLISGKAISQKYGKHPKELGKDSPIWEELAKYAAYGVYNSIVHWSPDVVVLGGSMFNEIGISVSRVAELVQRINKKYPQVPLVVHSALSDVGGLYGAMTRLKQDRF